MNIDEASGYLAMVEAMYNRNYMGAARKELIRNLLDENIEASMLSVTYLENKHDLLPTPVMLIKLVRDCGAQIRERESKERKQDLPKEIPVSNDEYVKRANTVSRMVYSGKHTREQILEGFRVMDSTYPDRGWNVQGSLLERFYIKGGHAMEGIPKSTFNMKI